MGFLVIANRVNLCTGTAGHFAFQSKLFHLIRLSKFLCCIQVQERNLVLEDAAISAAPLVNVSASQPRHLLLVGREHHVSDRSFNCTNAN